MLPAESSEEADCARKIITTLTTKAFRRPATDADIEVMTAFYRSGREEGGNFDYGIEAVVQRILTDPDFIYRAEIEPAECRAGLALPDQRSRAGLAPVVLPVEQHSGRGADQACFRKACMSPRC